MSYGDGMQFLYKYFFTPIATDFIINTCILDMKGAIKFFTSNFKIKKSNMFNIIDDYSMVKEWLKSNDLLRYKEKNLKSKN